MHVLKTARQVPEGEVLAAWTGTRPAVGTRRSGRGELIIEEVAADGAVC